jgi:hypothetical protein
MEWFYIVSSMPHTNYVLQKFPAVLRNNQLYQVLAKSETLIS